ncbi:MAG: uracil-DNA glycosylase family protein [Planctomycetota bacterium]
MAKRAALSDGMMASARALSATMDGLRFGEPVTHIYNPLRYAWAMHEAFLQKGTPKKTGGVVLLGMNPGPWGMAQTGVPFGEVAAVRDWMGLDEKIGRPKGWVGEHPKRPVLGLGCERSEVSGRRLWGLMAERFGTLEAFAERHAVVNYCPLVFMEAGGKNRTPDKLPAAERGPLEAACDAHLARVIGVLRPAWVVGVGAFAEKRAERVLAGMGDEASDVRVGRVLHPSPASPAANRGWAEQATTELETLGVW